MKFKHLALALGATVALGSTFVIAPSTQPTAVQAAEDAYTPISGVKYVNYTPGYSIAVWTSPYWWHSTTGQTLNHGTSWKVSGTVTTGGRTWYRVGYNQWVMSAYMSDTGNVARSMTATAYDPAVLGSSMGYSVIAANYGTLPYGTKVKITFANGTSKNYTVKDTGGFASANPNQIDIAMPNWQALQFGRQTVTVQVIG